MPNLTREQVAQRLGEYYSRKFSKETGKPAKVWSYFDDQKRAYCIQGSGLPAHPNLQSQYPNGWTMLDYIKPTKARRLIDPKRVPADFPVKELKPGDKAEDRATCGACGRSWDDAVITSYTPAPSARCPFEYFH